jgi:myosin X
VLHDGTFMWFKAKQDSIKAGWLTKMGGGTSTLGRKNWKRRYMTLKFGELAYLTGEEEGAEVKGVVDVLTATEISPLGEDFDKKSNVFQIVTPKRTYLMYADSPEEMAEWIDVLNSVRGKSLDQLKEMMAMARVDARNAQGSIELDEILSCGPDNRTDMEGHPMFVVMTADQLFKFVSPDAAEMNEWIRVLAPKKRTTTSIDDECECSSVRACACVRVCVCVCVCVCVLVCWCWMLAQPVCS